MVLEPERWCWRESGPRPGDVIVQCGTTVLKYMVHPHHAVAASHMVVPTPTLQSARCFATLRLTLTPTLIPNVTLTSELDEQ